MKPSIPVHWFDLCIIPKHDQYNGKGLVYRTNGALCDIKNKVKKNQKRININWRAFKRLYLE